MIFDHVEWQEILQPIFEVEAGSKELEALIVATAVGENSYIDYVRCQVTGRLADLRIFVDASGTKIWLHDTYNNGQAPEYLGHSLSLPVAEEEDIRNLVRVAWQRLKISRESLYEFGIPKRFELQLLPSALTLSEIDLYMHDVKTDIFNARFDALVWASFLGKASFSGTWRDLLPLVQKELAVRMASNALGKDDFFKPTESLEFEIDERVERALRNLRQLLNRFPAPLEVDEEFTGYLEHFTDDELVEVAMFAYYGESIFDERMKLILIEFEARRSGGETH
jgi:hypothetical protein